MNQDRDQKKMWDKSSKPRTWKAELRNTIAFYEKLLQRTNGKYTTINKTVSEKRASAVRQESVRKVSKGADTKNDVKPNHISVELTKEELEALQGIMQDLQRDEMHEVTYTPPAFDFFDFDAEFDPEMLWEDTDLDEYREYLAEDVIEQLKSIQQKLRNSEELVVSSEDYEDSGFILEEDYDDEVYISEDDYEEEPDISEDDYVDGIDGAERKYINLSVSEDDFNEIHISEEDYQE